MKLSLFTASYLLVGTLNVFGRSNEIGMAVNRGQRTVDPGILPLVCLTITTDDVALPIESLDIEEAATHKSISAKLVPSWGHFNSRVLTALEGDHRSLSMAILPLKPGRYRLTWLRFETLGEGGAAYSFDIARYNYFITVLPGYVNYAGSLVIKANWNAIVRKSVHGNFDETHTGFKFSSVVTIEQTAQRDEKWVADVVPGMARLPSVESSVCQAGENEDGSINTDAPLFNLSNLDRPPAAISQKPPVAPANSLKEGQKGIAQIEYIIETDGSVSHAIARKATEPAFAEAAIAAVMKWKFEAPLKGGKPVRVRVMNTIEFRR